MGRRSIAPAGAKIWNPVKAKMLAGQKVAGGTLFNVTDPTVYCAVANAGYDFVWTEMQHSAITWDQAAKMWGACPYARAVPGARVAYTNEKEMQHALDNGALVVVVPTVDTVEEAIEARDWAFFRRWVDVATGAATPLPPTCTAACQAAIARRSTTTSS